MIPHQTSVPRRDPSSAGDCAQSKRSAAVTELENAVAHFQATLTDEDRKRLKDLKRLPRDPQSIIVFTAELDMQQREKRRGKSIASRLTSFLQVVQQFTPIIDTYIQSNPDISAIIWSSIKLTFMIIYLIRQSTLANQVWKAITGSFQTEIKTYVENVKTKAENAKCEVELAKAQSDYEEQQQQTKERQNASDYRQQLSAWATKYSAAMKDLQDLKEKHCKDKKRVKLINELTSYSSMPTFNNMRNKRHMGTAEWCFHTPEYKGWANDNKSAILHITGKISRRFTSFFFFRFDESKSLSSSTVIRSCLQQLLASPLIETLDPGAMADLDVSLEEAKSSLFSAASLSSLFTTASKNLDDWFIVIDGLDEVDIIRQIGLLKFLRDVLDQLPEPHRIKLLLSSRETSSSDIDRILPQVTRLYTGLKPTSADIRQYAEDIISNKISTNELIVNDPGLENEIIEAIHRKEKGMFLWVFLTINDICSRKSDKDIRRALQDIPGDLHATFDRTLGRIAAKKNNTAIVQKAFTLIQASFEPLTLDQLREALSVDIGQQTLDRDDLISGVDRLPMWSENLICTEASDTVHFSHHSIQKYLLTPGSEGFKEFHLERDKCDIFMGELCVTYISLDNFQRALGFTRKCNTDSSSMNINMGGLAEQTIRTAVGDSIGSLIGRFTREAVGPSHITSPRKVQWNGSRLSSVPKHNFGPSQSSEEYTFFEYASKHWYKHQLCINSSDNGATWRLLGQILRRPHQYSQGEPWFQPAWKKAVSETIGNDVLFFGPGFDSYRETAVSLETDENGRLMNTSTLRDLCYVFIYAIQKRNAGLACRVFMLLVEDYKRPANRRLHGYLSIIINRMAVNKLHQSCENRCLSRARLQLSHSDLVRELRAAVASGISYFPQLDPNGAQQDCTCVQRAEYPLKEEMCRLLETGYQRHEQPYLFAFAVLAEELDTGSSVERLRTLNYDKRFDVELMLLSKTSFGRSFFDILIEGALTDMQRMQVFLSERLYTKERPRDQDNGLFGLLGKSDETEHIRLQQQLDNTLTFLGAVQAAATHGIEVIENSLTHCLETGGSVPLHKATITLLFDKILLRNRWPTSICYEEASETVLSRAVHSNSWELAASLIDILPVSTDERGAVGDFSYIKQALRCRDCRGIAMQMPRPRKKWSFDLRTNRCIKYGVQCPGYRDGLLFRSQLNPTNFGKGDKNHGTLEHSTSPSPSSSSLLSCSSPQAADSVPRSMHQHWTLHSIPIFLNVYSTLPLFYDMYRNIGDGPLLSATHLFSRAYVTILRQPTAKYNTSIIENDQELTTQLGKTLTSLLVGSGKRPDQSRTWNLHTQGLYSILKIRGSEWLRTSTSRTVFWPALNMAQIYSLSSNTECPQELEEWFVIIKEKMLPREAMVLYVSSFIFKACQVQARIFKILSSCDYDAARIAFYDIVASIRDARQELRAFAESPRTTIGLFDTYMGNLYAGTCIKVYSLLMALACFLSHQRPLSIPLDVLRSTHNQCINIAQNSAQNVLDTLPRALDTRAGPEMSPKTFFDAVKLVWPLRAIHAMPATSPEQKSVADKTLAFLGRDIGLKQALNIYTDFYEPLPVEARTILEVDGDPLDELERLMS
ncbi:heterokaryon incompatibility protein het-E-1 [Fusarium mexicanum]|uniref:Heterokaryon incompatibility protein het-E-1 n=1 Tax=Fusarium mexicanum TaxID=751941 RepID=A0A8H5JPC2_9HYPO|nr:heterokaryon incompatibility protein het-E-1 [Fusarium mexicanum]